MGNRYYYYLIAGTMTANVVAFVPRILINSRTDGMIVAIIIGTIIGMVLLYTYTTLMDQFPGKTYAELLDLYTPKWFSIGFTLITASIWFMSGLLFLLGFTFIARQFINPETSLSWMLGLLLIPLVFGMAMDSKRVLYATEIILLAILPLLLVIFIKAYTSDELDYTTMKIPLMHIGSMPTYFVIAAAGYTYDGVMNLAQFNKVFTRKRQIKYTMYIAIAAVGITNLLTASLVPIGINGIDGVGSLKYPWIVTADSFRIEFGFFERILFPFLLLLIAVAIIVILHHWHVSYRFFVFTLHFPRLKYKGKEMMPYLILVSFITISFIAIQKVDEPFIYMIEKWWFAIVQPAVTLHIIVLLYVYWRAKRCRDV